jgi:hypothetical protein
MHWERPNKWSAPQLVVIYTTLTVILFCMTWMGYGNHCAWPKCWGDPIPVSEALAKLLRILLMVLIVLAVSLGLEGIRSGRSGPQ